MMLHYILQIIIFQLGFLLVYEALLKKETFFNYNRLYLLLTPMLSFFLPMLKFPVLAEAVPEGARINLPAVWIGGAEDQVINLPEVVLNTSQTAEINWWLVVYLTGLAISIFLFARKYFILVKLTRFKKVSETGNLTITEVPGSRIACTFFNNIFIGEQLTAEERKKILSHELVHVKQKHSWDLLFFEFLKIVFWFNPLVYLYQSRIATLHEFIADADVVRTFPKKDYYNQLLNSAFNTQNISFINQFFSQSLIKKRIVMLQKNQSRTITKLKFLILVPLLLVMLTYVACSEEKTSGEMETSKIENATLTLEIQDLQNITSEERKEIVKAFEEMSEDAGYTKVQVTDGEKTLTLNGAPKVGETDISISNNGATNKSAASSQQEFDKMPFAVVDEVPVFPGCEELESREERKTCMSTSIAQFVNSNFDTNIGKRLGLDGITRVIVKFQINETGEVEEVKSRTISPGLEQEKRNAIGEEAVRVIESLPQMEPGRQNGKPISVMYSLPIVFNNAG